MSEGVVGEKCVGGRGGLEQRHFRNQTRTTSEIEPLEDTIPTTFTLQRNKGKYRYGLIVYGDI